MPYKAQQKQSKLIDNVRRRKRKCSGRTDRHIERKLGFLFDDFKISRFGPILRDSVREQETDRFTVVCASAGLCQCRADIDGVNLVAHLLLLLVGYCVGHDDTVQATVVDVLNGIAGENAVYDNSVDLLGAVLHDGVGGFDESTTCIGHVVNNDRNLVFDISDEDHSRDLVGTRTFLVDESELQVETVRNPSSTIEDKVNLRDRKLRVKQSCLPLRTTGIGTDNDAVLHIQVFPDPLQHARLSIQVINRDIEETLNLTGVKVHRNDMVAAGGLEHVRHQFRGDRRTALVFLILTRVGEVGNNSCDTACRGSLAGVDHDKKLHQSVIDIVGFRGLQDEHCREQRRRLTQCPQASSPVPPNNRSGRQYHLRLVHFHQL
jgi:hypothetical protein